MRNSGKPGLIRTPQRRRCSQTTTTRRWTALDACSSFAAGVPTGPSRRSDLLYRCRFRWQDILAAMWIWTLHKSMTHHSFSTISVALSPKCISSVKQWNVTWSEISVSRCCLCLSERNLFFPKNSSALWQQIVDSNQQAYRQIKWCFSLCFK